MRPLLALLLNRQRSCWYGHPQTPRTTSSSLCQTLQPQVVFTWLCIWFELERELEWDQIAYMMITRSLRALLAARTSASACRFELAGANQPARQMSSGPTTATPPADASRGATADLCDVFLPDPVDEITESKVSIVAPLFRKVAFPYPPCTRPHLAVVCAASLQ